MLAAKLFEQSGNRCYRWISFNRKEAIAENAGLGMEMLNIWSQWSGLKCWSMQASFEH